ncbi:MAG TPA: glycerol-3-phosphate 1-O-acyltransferase PlsY [Bacteroidota bacterium]|nr:glycerol-3-phosphate 1-O-acyltransferase PlsY [Bacteroidota bacterium]
MLPLAFVIVVAYLVGSIPTSLIVSKFFYGIDIREHGSGNAGGTNAMRVLGFQPGMLVILVDFFKGYAASMLVAKLFYGPIPFNNRTPFEDYTVVQIISGCAAIIGHTWTAFGGLRGGKGIATACGVLIGLAPIESLVSLGVFTVVLVLFRIVSLGSISAALSLPLAMFARHNVFHAELYGYHTLIYFSLGITLLLVYNHRSNIKRLLEGREHRLSAVRLKKKHK